MSLVTEVGRETFLKEALEPVAGDYDDIVIDTPPNLGMLTVNALTAADVVLPVRPGSRGSELECGAGRHDWRPACVNRRAAMCAAFAARAWG